MHNDITSVENILSAWQEFVSGKRNKPDVLEFQKDLMKNIFSLHRDLKDKTYRHGNYKAFNISDPKPRNIHKASVRDRLLHHAIYRILYPHYDKMFIHDSYSCRLGKGTHRAIRRLEKFGRQVSQNNTRQCWVLKCDIRKFFASINHQILKNILCEYIADKNILWLLGQVIDSFSIKGKENTGLPLGNLTSQLLVNIYMNKFDQWMKHRMKVKYYIRYADDFVILNKDKDYLWELAPKIADFLEEELKLSLHPSKLFVKTLSSGVDFLGWINFPNHRVLRASTKRKMFRNIKSKTDEKQKENSIASYLGMLKWGNGYKLQKLISDSAIYITK